MCMRFTRVLVGYFCSVFIAVSLCTKHHESSQRANYMGGGWEGGEGGAEEPRGERHAQQEHLRYKLFQRSENNSNFFAWTGFGAIVDRHQPRGTPHAANKRVKAHVLRDIKASSYEHAAI